MSTVLYIKDATPPALWPGVGNSWYTVKDSSRSKTAGADTIENTYAVKKLSTTIGTGVGVAVTGSTISGPTAGKFLHPNLQLIISDPVDADFTLSGTVTFNWCGLESSMNANTTGRFQVYRLDSDGLLTLIVDSTLGTEFGTSLARNTWTATPTSTAMKKGDRIAICPMIDDANSVNMGNGFTITLRIDGSNANTADSNITFTETFGFLTSDPTGTGYYLRDTASDISGGKVLSTTQGSGTATAVHTTIAGAITYPGDQWTATAGGSDIEWYTPALDAFTLGGVVKCELGANSVVLEIPGISPFDALTVEIAVVDSNGANPVVWARSYTCSATADALKVHYLTGADLSVGQGKRLRLRVFSDDDWPNTQASGTNRTIRYDGTSTYAAKLTFTQTITEASTNQTVAPGTGSLVISGKAPSVKIDNIVRPGVGALSLTGFAPTVKVNTIVAPGQGAITLTGFSPTVTHTENQIVQPGVGQLTITGFAPTVTKTDNQFISPGTGQLAISGLAPTVRVGIDIKPGVGSLTLTGYSPTVIASDNKVIAPGIGTIILSGFAPNIVASDNKTVFPGVGSLVIAGFAPSIKIDNIIRPGLGQLSLTGYSPTVITSSGTVVFPGTGSLVITGFSSTVTVNNIVSPGLGQLALTGFPPTITSNDNKVVAPNTGQLSISGLSPTITTSDNKVVSPGTGTLSIIGFAPTVTKTDNQFVSPGVGSIVISGFAPNITVADNKTVSPGLGQLSITSFAPSVFTSDNKVVAPGRGQLSILGFAPTILLTDNKIVAPGRGQLIITGFAPLINEDEDPAISFGGQVYPSDGYY